ncbi:hypothetical protein PVAP13_3NG079764 [Panicum virgatum]|uniref:Pentatricopeptide repeat-containing protein n=1 Tax=Panicum virgatum TaxID=38727 RepID=A0A8T0UCQ5_PANVG|nr:hypothetical protein PVAP13_3NG079764 [Panicum virgatum]
MPRTRPRPPPHLCRPRCLRRPSAPLLSLFSGACRGLDPGPHLISVVLAACADLPHLYGRQVHARTTKAVPPNGVFVYTRLVDAYAKAGDMAASRKLGRCSTECLTRA